MNKNDTVDARRYIGVRLSRYRFEHTDKPQETHIFYILIQGHVG